MIKLADKVRMECDEPGCDTCLRVSLVLLPTGGFGIDVPASAVGRWQLVMDSSNPTMPYKARCHEHRAAANDVARGVPSRAPSGRIIQ